MDIMELGTQLLQENLGGNAQGADLQGALSSLLGDGAGGIDLQALVGKLTESGDLGSIVSSWLGDGANSPISADKLLDIFGEGQLSEFASQLGTDSQGAASSLSEVLPQLLDQSSSGGSLLDSVGGVGGLMDAAKSFLK